MLQRLILYYIETCSNHYLMFNSLLFSDMFIPSMFRAKKQIVKCCTVKLQAIAMKGQGWSDDQWPMSEQTIQESTAVNISLSNDNTISVDEPCMASWDPLVARQNRFYLEFKFCFKDELIFKEVDKFSKNSGSIMKSVSIDASVLCIQNSILGSWEFGQSFRKKSNIKTLNICHATGLREMMHRDREQRFSIVENCTAIIWRCPFTFERTAWFPLRSVIRCCPLTFSQYDVRFWMWLKWCCLLVFHRSFRLRMRSV